MRLVLVLGDQLTAGAGALARADRASDVVVMAEVMEETTYVPHRPKKIALFLAAMRKFAAALRRDGWRVVYSRLDDRDNTGSLVGEVRRRAAEFSAETVLVTTPGEWRLRQALKALPLKVTFVEDDRFLCPQQVFRAWAQGRRVLRLEHFYRLMRRRTGLLMEGEAPAGGQWNFDRDNRKPARADLLRAPPYREDPDDVVAEVLDLVRRRFAQNFGTLDGFAFATDRSGARRALQHFLAYHLPHFGPTQDAMLAQDRFLHHSVLSAYLNLGLLTPGEVCTAAEAEWQAGRVPIGSVEGFIRQILGWREYVRGIYDLAGPGYAQKNALGHDRPLPAFYWGAPTRMACVAHVVEQTRAEAYAHHIQRLMVTGNFALLAGIAPAAVHEWYLSVYADAVEWVEAPNVIGMALFADGGILASKPYAASGAYIARMSNYCRGCYYDVHARSGPRACPFNRLYWHFLERHRSRFATNPRMVQIYRAWDRVGQTERTQIVAEAEALLADLDSGAFV